MRLGQHSSSHLLQMPRNMAQNLPVSPDELYHTAPSLPTHRQMPDFRERMARVKAAKRRRRRAALTRAIAPAKSMVGASVDELWSVAAANAGATKPAPAESPSHKASSTHALRP